jgi:hypothetical protein
VACLLNKKLGQGSPLAQPDVADLGGLAGHFCLAEGLELVKRLHGAARWSRVHVRSTPFVASTVSRAMAGAGRGARLPPHARRPQPARR